MSFSAISLNKKIKVLLYHHDAVIRVMAEFSEYVIQSSFHRYTPQQQTRLTVIKLIRHIAGSEPPLRRTTPHHSK